MFACTRRLGYIGFEEACIHVRSVGGMERGFVVVVCKACKDPPCAKVCPTGAMSPREEGGVILDEQKCIGCGMCREACIIGAIQWNNDRNKPTVCSYCGYCTDFCPHGVLEFDRDGGETDEVP